jgi:Leucine-rich repeat (LRR) protein
MSDVNWIMVLSASILSGILSLLTSIAGLPELKENDINGNLIVSSNANEELLSLEITPEQLKGIDTNSEMTFKVIHK